MKQQTPLQKLIEKLRDRIKKYAEFNNGDKDVSSILALQDAESLLPEEEQMVSNAFDKGGEISYTVPENGEQYFNETFEK